MGELTSSSHRVTSRFATPTAELRAFQAFVFLVLWSHLETTVALSRRPSGLPTTGVMLLVDGFLMIMVGEPTNPRLRFASKNPMNRLIRPCIFMILGFGSKIFSAQVLKPSSRPISVQNQCGEPFNTTRHSLPHPPPVEFSKNQKEVEI